MTLAKRVYDYQGEQFEVSKTSTYSATVNKGCETCAHEAYIIGTVELNRGWVIGKKQSEERPYGPIDTFPLAVDWCCYFLLMECKGITYVDEFFAEGLRVFPRGHTAPLPPSDGVPGGQSLSRREYERGERIFEVVRISMASLTVTLSCQRHEHLEIELEMAEGGMREWRIRKSGDLLGQDDTFGGDELEAAVKLCCDSLLQECQASVQLDEFFNGSGYKSPDSVNTVVASVSETRDITAYAKRVHQHGDREFEVSRTSLDSAIVKVKCGMHEHDDIIVGRKEVEGGWLMGRGTHSFGPMDKIEDAVAHCEGLLVDECKAAVQVEEFFPGGEPTLKERLEALAAFLPKFESPGFKFGQMQAPTGKMPYYKTSALASQFVQTCYKMGWVKPFDWAEWMQSTEAKRLRDDPAALANGTWEQLRRLLTVMIRQDRFVEGALGSAFESGLLTGIVRRASVLARDTREAAA